MQTRDTKIASKPAQQAENQDPDDGTLGLGIPWWVLLAILVAAAAFGIWQRGN